ncbi:hypothetical protein BT63DRAFT_408618 [Microthyrium microscopicum]|uniref:AA9 family lytic polysaccharide monooxygenase n=1 Tax=Microthyrium microscopicum TaxID=703497 RepID=A0A6A6UQ60_9PEZI|nr:hypothetical protein BT63DRAFT_408618 [Microthyrium microscopicum]
MKSTSVIASAIALLSAVTEGHYMFQTVKSGSQGGGVYQFVRKNTNHNSPVVDLGDKDLRCNVGGTSGASTETMPVAAGSTVTFGADTAVYHQGPISFYMTQVPDAKTADGSTPWFKVKDIGPTFAGGQAKWDMSKNYSVKIPSCIAPGDYLLRIQQLAIHNPGGKPQFYISCAQIKVSGGASTLPKPTVSIPGAFKASDSGYTANIYNNFKSYTVPGPSVFTC